MAKKMLDLLRKNLLFVFSKIWSVDIHVIDILINSSQRAYYFYPENWFNWIIKHE